MTYCHNCDWLAGIDDGTDAERSRLALQHFVRTGYPIDSGDSLC